MPSPKDIALAHYLEATYFIATPGASTMPIGHFQSGMGVRWNLKFRSYPDVNAQRFMGPKSG